jgi:hypothetical protein
LSLWKYRHSEPSTVKNRAKIRPEFAARSPVSHPPRERGIDIHKAMFEFCEAKCRTRKPYRKRAPAVDNFSANS